MKGSNLFGFMKFTGYMVSVREGAGTPEDPAEIVHYYLDEHGRVLGENRRGDKRELHNLERIGAE